MKIKFIFCKVIVSAIFLSACGSKPATDVKHDEAGHDLEKEEKKDAKAARKDGHTEDHKGQDHGAGDHGADGKAEHVVVELDQQKANRFEFATAEERSASRTIQTTGTISLNETKVARLRPLSRGRISTVSVRVGDAVRKGQELLSYDNVELGEAVAQYRRGTAQVQRARTEAGVASRALERARNLVELGGIAKTELDKREADAKNAEAAIEAEIAEQSLWNEKLYRFGLGKSDIDALSSQRSGAIPRQASIVAVRSPLDGIVLKMNAAEGEAIQLETQLFEIVDTSTLWVQADLYERDLSSVKVGDVATVSVEAYPDEKFRGRVTYISDVVDRDSRAPKIRCEVPNPGRRLKLDMYATIQLPGRGERKVLMVPAGAVQKLEGRDVVFVREEPNEFEIRPVRLGVEVQGWIEIVTGIKAGETVATRGSFVLKSEHLKAELGEAGHSHD